MSWGQGGRDNSPSPVIKDRGRGRGSSRLRDPEVALVTAVLSILIVMGVTVTFVASGHEGRRGQVDEIQGCSGGHPVFAFS